MGAGRRGGGMSVLLQYSDMLRATPPSFWRRHATHQHHAHAYTCRDPLHPTPRVAPFQPLSHLSLPFFLFFSRRRPQKIKNTKTHRALLYSPEVARPAARRGCPRLTRSFAPLKHKKRRSTAVYARGVAYGARCWLARDLKPTTETRRVSVAF